MPTLMEPPPAEEQSSELFRALCDAGVDAETAYRVDREVRSQAGQNVIAAIHASAAETRADNKALMAEMNARFREMKAENDARFAEIKAHFGEVRAEIKALHSRIDTLQRVVWPLVLLVVSTGFGVLYRFLIDN